MSRRFDSEVHSRLLVLNVMNVTDLPFKSPKGGVVEDTLSGGGGVDCYVVIGVGGERDVGNLGEKDKINGGVEACEGVWEVLRTETIWENSGGTSFFKEAKEEGEMGYVKPKGGFMGIGKSTPGARFGEGGEVKVAYLRRDEKAPWVGFTVMDQSVLGEDGVIGSFAMPVKDIDGGKEGVYKLTTRGPRGGKNQRAMMGAAAGAMVGGPPGAVVGGLVAGGMEERVKGNIAMRGDVREIKVGEMEEERGGLGRLARGGGVEGVDWGEIMEGERMGDLEWLVYMMSEDTGCCVNVYRSREEKTVVVAFRGTCELKDLITDGSVLQTTWREGDEERKDTEYVHKGFRDSLQSVSERLKGIMFDATGGEVEEWNCIVTGHSLGGALANMCVRDIGENGLDQTVGLPVREREGGVIGKFVGSLLGQKPGKKEKKARRFKKLSMYTYGAPRVGNEDFCKKFDSLLEDCYTIDGVVRRKIDCAWRVVNGRDVVARLPRTIEAAVFGRIGYDHCGKTALVSPMEVEEKLWLEGVSDGKLCPVRDGVVLTSPLGKGNVLGDVWGVVEEGTGKGEVKGMEKVRGIVDGVTGRIGEVKSLLELASVVGIDSKYAEREVAMLESIVNGEGLMHHLEGEYFVALGRLEGRLGRVIERKDDEKEEDVEEGEEESEFDNQNV